MGNPVRDSIRGKLQASEFRRKLPDHRIAGPEAPIDEGAHLSDADPVAFNPKVRALSAQLQARAKAALAKEQADFIRQHPEAAGLKLHVGPTYVSKPRPAGSHHIPVAILDYMLRPGGPSDTQAAILADIQARYPEHKISKNIWQQPQAKWQLAELSKRVLGGMAPFRDADIKGCKTLNDFRRALKAVSAAHASSSYKAAITVTPEAVVINGRPWKRGEKKSKGHTYPVVTIRVDQLIDVLNSQGHKKP